MLIAVDVSNTHTKVGLFAPDGTLRVDWRLRTTSDATEDELAAAYAQVLELHDASLSDISQLIVASVVPQLSETYRRFVSRYLTGEALVVGPGIRTGMRIASDNPHEVGADRIVNAVAAWDRYQTACIVVDMGTATTWDAISADGAYLGGAIAPGIGISIDALVSHAAQLASVELTVPERAIGTNTVASMQSGSLIGTIAQVEGMLDRFRVEMGGGDIPAIATGGHARRIASHVRGLTDIDSLLTLRGLHLIALRQKTS